MRKNFGPQCWLYPMPALIVGTFNEDGSPNAMNAAWGGIHDTNQIAVCIAPEHKTAANLQKRKCFTVSIADAAHVVECDFFGIASGNDTPDKIKKAKFHAEKAEFIDAPVFAELPMTLECELVSYDNSTGCAVANIVNVSADEKIIAANGKIDPAKFIPVCYDPVNHKYLKLGEAAGTAFKDGLSLK